MKNLQPRKGTRAAANIRLLVLDVDGVMTDGRLYYSARGEELKVFHVRDGLGIRALADAGVEIAVISGRSSPAVKRRCRDLGIRHLAQGVDDKLPVFERLRKRLKLASSQCACIGDDAVDVPMMKSVGLAFAVADAHPQAQRAAHIVTTLGGGLGAVREACDFLLTARNV